MKTLVKLMSVAVLTATLGLFAFAQETPKPDLTTMYTTFREKLKVKCGERDEALTLGKQIIELYGADELNKEVIDYVKKKVAAIEAEDPKCKIFTAYDASFKAKNWDLFFTTSKKIMAMEGDSPLGTDVLLQHVSTGFDRATEKGGTDKYNAETKSYAELALQKLAKPSVASLKNEWGVFDPFTTKDNATSWMNYIVGWMLDKSGKKRESLGYIYKSTLTGTEKKADLQIYKTIGDYYFDEATRLYKEYDEKRKANAGVETDELKVVLGTARANADRGIDAYGRAYKIALADPKGVPAARTAFLKDTTTLYKFRFNKPEADKVPELEGYINAMVAKPMPDPTSPVTPVVEAPKPEVPATTTTTPGSTTPATPAKPTTPATTTVKPSTTPVKPATTPAKPTATTTPEKKSTAKKSTTTVKKKGTR